MPQQERSLPVDGRQGGEPSSSASPPLEAVHREAMAGNTWPQGADDNPTQKKPPLGQLQGQLQEPLQEQLEEPSKQASGPPSAAARERHWDEEDWEHGHDEAACHQAQRLLSRSSLSFHRLGDRFAALQRWLVGERWVRRLAIVTAALIIIFFGCFGGLWWRLGAGPINLDMATPWLAEAIQQNIGNGNTVEVGGTQIERAGRIRVAVRIRDIVVRDRDHAVVASAPKAEVRLSGAALLMGRLRAESLSLVDAVLAVRITPDGYVTVSAGDTAKPLATGVAKRVMGGAPVSPPTATSPPIRTVPSLRSSPAGWSN